MTEPSPDPLRSAVPATDAPAAERRHLTIIFCDMVASTELADRLDPEDFYRHVQRFLQTCAGAIQRRNGVVASYIGDAVKGFFGYPLADEDDAETACIAAFDVIEDVAALAKSSGQQIEVRIGVASGKVVVGAVEGAPAGVSAAAFGHAANLASRLQMLALPNTVLVDQATAQAASRAIDFVDHGRHRLKGVREPVQVWRAQRARSVTSRFAKRARLTRLCGRDKELARLLSAWGQVSAEGGSKIAVITGDAGIGKSRLMHELHLRSRADKHLIIQCSPAFENSTLHPVLRAFRRWAGIEDREPLDETLRKLRAALAISEVAVEQSLPVVANLLGLTGADDPGLAAIGSDRQRTIMKRLLTDWIAHLADGEPLLVLFEDAQWADVTTKELLASLVVTRPKAPMLIVASARWDVAQGDLAGDADLRIELKPLDREDASTMALDLVTRGGLDTAVVADVLARAEGVPLFIEELALEAAGTTDLPSVEPGGGGQGDDDIPVTVQSALLARIDRLPSAKDLVQIAATIGREFDIDLLRGVSGYPQERLQAELDSLIESGLIVGSGGEGHAALSFKHALLQQAVQSTMLRERRQALHARIAVWLESRDATAASAYPELLAQHFTDAGTYDRAADYWLLAGRKAARTWAKAEAARLFKKGLDAAAALPEAPERRRRQLELELELGDVLYASLGYASDEGVAAYHRAIGLSETLDDVAGAIRAHDGLFGMHFNTGQFDRAIEASDRLIAIGSAHDIRKALVLGLQFKGMSVFAQGHLPQADDHLRRALSYRDHQEEIGSDYPSMGMLYRSWAKHILGHHAAALELYREADAIVRAQEPYRLAACLGNGCVLFALRNEPARVRQLVQELLPIAEANGFNLWTKMARIFEGWSSAQIDGTGSSTDLMRGSITSLGQQEVDKTCYLALLASSYRRTGNHDAALATAQAGLDQAYRLGEHYCTALLLSERGEIEFRLDGDGRRAERSFREAIDVARRQQARSWELVGAQALARLLRLEGRADEADASLAPIMAWFATAGDGSDAPGPEDTACDTSEVGRGSSD